MDEVKWIITGLFLIIDLLFGAGIAFLIYDRNQVSQRFSKLEKNKVDCEICKEKGKGVVAQFKVITSQMARSNIDNKTDYNDLKQGIADLNKNYGKFNTDTQVSLSKLSGCIDRLSNELKRNTKEENG